MSKEFTNKKEKYRTHHKLAEAKGNVETDSWNQKRKFGIEHEGNMTRWYISQTRNMINN